MEQLNIDDERAVEVEVEDKGATAPEEPVAVPVSVQPPEATPNFPLPVELLGKILPQLDRRWLIKGLLMSGTSTVIFGLPGAGKSFFAIDIALHVATGRTWFDQKVAQGGVVYIAAEGQAGIRNRIAAWEKLNGISANVPFALIPATVDLLDPNVDFEKLNQTLKLLEASWGNIAFFVIDTLAATFGGGDENGHDMTIYVNNVVRLCQQYKCALAIITHAPLVAGPRPRPRGHGSLLGAMDTAIHIATVGANGARLARVTKQKDDDPGEGIYFRLEPVEIGSDEDGETVTSCCLMPSDKSLPSKSDGGRLNERQSLAFTILQAVIAAEGIEPADAIPETEAGCASRICLESAWQDAFVKAIYSSDKQPDTFRRAFPRARDALLSAEIVRRYGKWVWLAD